MGSSASSAAGFPASPSFPVLLLRTCDKNKLLIRSARYRMQVHLLHLQSRYRSFMAQILRSVSRQDGIMDG